MLLLQLNFDAFQKYWTKLPLSLSNRFRKLVEHYGVGKLAAHGAFRDTNLRRKWFWMNSRNFRRQQREFFLPFSFPLILYKIWLQFQNRLTASILAADAQLFQLVTSDYLRESLNFQENFKFTPRENNCLEKVAWSWLLTAIWNTRGSYFQENWKNDNFQLCAE
jgi:hypothetical protein